MMTPDAIAPFHFVPGTRPVLLSIPHVGTHIPEALRSDYTEVAWQRADTDWHLDRLYAFAHQFGASVLRATHSRSVIDLNRPPDNQSLYPGRITTGLCPTETFRGEPLYQAGRAPDAAETARRLSLYWRPYHETLAAELDRLRSLHGQVLLWDAHSIASELPRLQKIFRIDASARWQQSTKGVQRISPRVKEPQHDDQRRGNDWLSLDIAYVAPVYPAGEEPLPGVDHTALVAGMKARGHRAAREIAGAEALAEVLVGEIQPGESRENGADTASRRGGTCQSRSVEAGTAVTTNARKEF
jgi:predicted N-formylglutamate amidohydrolase